MRKPTGFHNEGKADAGTARPGTGRNRGRRVKSEGTRPERVTHREAECVPEVPPEEHQKYPKSPTEGGHPPNKHIPTMAKGQDNKQPSTKRSTGTPEGTDSTHRGAGVTKAK